MATRQEPDDPRKSTTSALAPRLFSVAGIPIRVHFTFLLFMLWVAIAGQNRGGGMWPALVAAIFVCVLLHELGHALTARRFGVQTRDITLYPMGGVAMLEGRPTPRQELWIALAGPAVNVLIAIVLGVVLAISGAGIDLERFLNPDSFVLSLLISNIVLAIFNLVPAFPMDGGRVLRAILALFLPEARATQIAAGIGQFLAVVFGIIGILGTNVIFMLIAFFVFIGASQEVTASVTRTLLTGHKVADAMQVRFRTITSGESLETAAEMLLAGSQHDFPVVNGDEVIGILSRSDIARGLAHDGPTGYVAGHMARLFATANPHLPLERAMDIYAQSGSTPIIVLDDDRLVGMLTGENLSEFIMLQHAKNQGRAAV